MNESQSEITVEKMLYDHALEKQIPISGTFELIPLCNLNCRMCYIRIDRAQMEHQGHLHTGAEWISLAERAAKEGMLFLLLTGGEPLLHPDFQEIYCKIQKMGVFLTINTNGTLITPQLADFFAENLPRRINLTLYGSKPETYRRLCGSAIAFEQAAKAVRLLKERHVPVKLNATISRYNIDDLQGILELADHWELPIEIPYYLFPQSRKEDRTNTEEYRLSSEEAAKLRMAVAEHSFQGDKAAFRADITNALREIEKMDNIEFPPKPSGFWCRAGCSGFWVNWKGQMTTCGMIDAPSVNAFQVPFQEAWETVLSHSTNIELSDQCYTCRYRTVCAPCAASMYTETGTFDGVPGYRCGLMHYYEELMRTRIRDWTEEA